MSEVRRTEYQPQAAGAATQQNGAHARASHLAVYRPVHEDRIFPIFSTHETLRPGIGDAPSKRNHAGGLKLLLSRVDYGMGNGICEAPLSQADVSGPAAF